MVSPWTTAALRRLPGCIRWMLMRKLSLGVSWTKHSLSPVGGEGRVRGDSRSRSRWIRVVPHDVAGDAVTRGTIGQGVAGEPARVLQLRVIHAELAARIGRHEAQHDLAREGPVLAAHVVDVLDVHAHLFLDFAGHAALERLPVFHEARHEGVAAGRPLRLAGE